MSLRDCSVASRWVGGGLELSDFELSEPCSDDDDSSKTSSLHGSESSKSLSSSPPPSQREATEQSRKDIRRERNRQHARVSRERKRKKMQSLEEENVALKARVAELEAALAAR